MESFLINPNLNYMYKIFSIASLFCLLAFSLSGQTLKQWLDAAEVSAREGDYYEAFRYYEIALEYDETRLDVRKAYAEMALKFKAYSYAEPAYKYIVDQDPDDHLALYWLAYAQHRQGKYQDAMDHYNEFIAIAPDSLSHLIDEADLQIENCAYAELAVNEPKEVEIRHLDTLINTPDSEFAPHQVGDTLYYSSLHYLYEKDDHNPPRTYSKILYTRNEALGTPLDAVNVPGKHVSHTTMSKDGKWFYYSLCEYVTDDSIRCDLFVREKLENDVWGSPRPLQVNLPPYTTAQPSLGWDSLENKTVLFFVSDRNGGAGGKDIWAAYQNEDGLFDSPFNLSELNTPKDEISPYFHNESQRLYFSSNGYPTLGGFDIYNSHNAITGWTEPYNMGAPLNTSYDESYYHRVDCGMSYFSSNKWGSVFLVDAKETCCNDIYAVSIDVGMTLDLMTFNAETGMDLEGVKIEIYELVGEVEVLLETLENPTDNDFTYEVERCKKYVIKASRPGFKPASVPLDLTPSGKDLDVDIKSEFEYPKEVKKKIHLEPLIVDLVIKPCDEDRSIGLVGALIRFSELDLETGALSLLEEKVNEEEQDIYYKAYVNRTYQLELSKEGYFPRIDTIKITDTDVQEYGTKIEIDACLKEDPLPNIRLYFDNAIPGAHPNRNTAKIYDELYESYYGLKQDYVDTYTQGVDDNNRFVVTEGYNAFFERQVRAGREKLGSFADKLHEFLEQGSKYTIRIRGFSSPRGPSEYNELLSSRRINSVINFLEKYDGGKLKPFINSGQLEILQESYGESTAASEISDDLKDRNESIFSVVASVERRVEIMVIKPEEEDQ